MGLAKASRTAGGDHVPPGGHHAAPDVRAEETMHTDHEHAHGSHLRGSALEQEWLDVFELRVGSV